MTRANSSSIEATPCPTCFPGLAGAEWNMQYGYGRPNVYKAMKAVHEGDIPPTADITAPEWYDEVDPTQQSTVPVSADVAARRSPSYGWELQYAAGPEPADTDFHTFASGSGSAPQTVERLDRPARNPLELLGRASTARRPPTGWRSSATTSPCACA